MSLSPTHLSASVNPVNVMRRQINPHDSGDASRRGRAGHRGKTRLRDALEIGYIPSMHEHSCSRIHLSRIYVHVFMDEDSTHAHGQTHKLRQYALNN